MIRVSCSEKSKRPSKYRQRTTRHAGEAPASVGLSILKCLYMRTIGEDDYISIGVSCSALETSASRQCSRRYPEDPALVVMCQNNHVQFLFQGLNGSNKSSGGTSVLS